MGREGTGSGDQLGLSLFVQETRLIRRSLLGPSLGHLVFGLGQKPGLILKSLLGISLGHLVSILGEKVFWVLCLFVLLGKKAVSPVAVGIEGCTTFWKVLNGLAPLLKVSHQALLRQLAESTLEASILQNREAVFLVLKGISVVSLRC